MMEIARGLGIAARFVSGYLYDAALDTTSPPIVRNTGLQQGVRQVESRDEPLVQGAGATHAWLNVFLPGAGWVPYDPTNTLVGGTDLIRVAYTRKPEQAPPVSGSWSGAAADFDGMDVAVSVQRVRQPAELSGISTYRLPVGLPAYGETVESQILSFSRLQSTLQRSSIGVMTGRKMKLSFAGHLRTKLTQIQQNGRELHNEWSERGAQSRDVSSAVTVAAVPVSSSRTTIFSRDAFSLRPKKVETR